MAARTLGPDDDDEDALPLQSGIPSSSAATVVDGRYRVLGKLGSGAMGVVYHVEDVLLQRPAAIKLLDPSIGSTPAAEKNLLREARALARLRHDNVVQIYSSGIHEKRFFFAMELVDGESLEEIIVRAAEKGEQLSLAWVLDVVAKVASGLSAAHEQGLIHRDVKPSNIVIERDTQRPVLIDFGIAREVTGTVRSSFVVAGTPSYMAPEQIAHDRKRISHKADLYSLACTTFELLTARLLFDDLEAFAMLHAHVSRTPPTLSQYRPDLGPLDHVLARALAKMPAYRHDSCVDFAIDLANAARESGLLTASKISMPKVTPPDEPRRLRRVLVLLADDRVRQSLVSGVLTALADPKSSLSIECTTEPSALLASFTEQPSELVVIDEDMADGGALELARQLRALPTVEDGPRLQILVITRNVILRREEWQSLGVRRVAKPLNMRALTATLEEIGNTLRR